jgi:hypothetical protein
VNGLYPIVHPLSDVTAIIQAMAWPVASVIIAMMFRTEIGRAMERLVRLRFHDVEAQFRHDLLQSEDLAAGNEPRRLHDLPNVVRRMTHELDLSGQQWQARTPAVRIREAWSRVTAASDRAAGTAGIDPLPTLIERGLLPGMNLLLFERLRRLRAQLDLATDWQPSSSDADRFVKLAHTLAARLTSPPPRIEDGRA